MTDRPEPADPRGPLLAKTRRGAGLVPGAIVAVLLVVILAHALLSGRTAMALFGLVFLTTALTAVIALGYPLFHYRALSRLA